MDTFTAILLVASDAGVIVALWLWRGHGRPVPARLEWMKRHRATRWIFNLTTRPVPAGW